MRSSKSRSRSKSNRSRASTIGNIVNRVFESSGPEGKVRGTPQQIIEKYTQLARDAQLGNDRVAAENFQQHAEHYTRMLGEAQREQDARREQQEAQQASHQQNQQNNQNNQNNQNRNRDRMADSHDQSRYEPVDTPEADDGDDNLLVDLSYPSQPQPDPVPAPVDDPVRAPASEQVRPRAPAPKPKPATAKVEDVIDVSEPERDSGLVETPESAPETAAAPAPRLKPKRTPRARKPKVDTSQIADAKPAE